VRACCHHGRVAESGNGDGGSAALVRADPMMIRAPALYRIPFSLAALGLLLIAMQAGRPVAGLALLFALLFGSASIAWRSFSQRHAPALALRAQGDKALRGGAYDEARSHYERALSLVQRDLPASSPEVLLNCYSLATVSSMLHDRQQADDYLRRLLDGLDGRVPASWRAQLAWLLRRVAQQHSHAGQHARAIELCETALELVGPAPGADDTTVRSIVDDIAWVHHHAGEYACAERLFRESLSIHEQFRDAAIEAVAAPGRGSTSAASPYRVPGPQTQPTTGGLDRAVAFSLLGLGGATLLDVEILRGAAAIEVSLGDYERAARSYDAAAALVGAGAGGEPSAGTQYAALCVDRGWLARSRGDYDAADEHYQRAAAAIESSESSGAIACALHESIAELRRRQGRLRDAAREIGKAATLAAACLGAEHPRVASIEAVASRIHSARGDLTEAEKCARRCLTVLRVTFPPDHPRFAEGWLALGEMHLQRSQFGAAHESFSRALALREQTLGARHPELGEVIDGLVAVLRATSREAEAEELLRRRSDSAAA
jgi:tetratricopeptide (TPR) repeat protein